MALYTYQGSSDPNDIKTVDSSTDLMQTAGGSAGKFQLAPNQSTATNYYSYLQSPEKYKQGDVILESPNTNYQSPIIQQMAQQNSLKDYTDPSTGKKIGWQVATPYKLPTTTAGTPNSITGTDPMNINNELLQMQRDALAQQQAAAQQQYESDKSTINQSAATQAQNVQDIGGRATGSLRRILGRAGGFTTTAGATALVNQDDKITSQLNQLEVAKQNALQAASAALATNNAKISQQAFENLQKINDQIYQRQQDQIANFIKFQQLQMSQTENQFNIVSKLGEGQTYLDPVTNQTFVGIKKADVDPFWTSASLVSLMKELPVGTSQEIVDPNTGQVFTISGLQTNDPSIKSVQSYDDAGNLTITSYRVKPDGTFELLSQADGGQIGKTKTQASNVSVNFPRMNQQAVYDKNNKQVGYAWSNPITGSTEYKDFNGNIIPFPEGGRIASEGSFTTTDPLEDALNALVGE